MHAALTLADRVVITVPLASHLPYTRRILRSYGLENFVTGIKPIGGLRQDIKSRKTEIFDITTGLIRTLIDEGAEIIVAPGWRAHPLCGGPGRVRRGDGRAGAQHKAICVRFAEMCVNFKMTQSALTYPRGKRHPRISRGLRGSLSTAVVMARNAVPRKRGAGPSRRA